MIIKRPELIALLFISIFILMALSAPDIYPGDSPEYSLSAKFLGIPHPPGSPLYPLSVSALSPVISGEPVHEANITSAIFGGCAIVLTAITALCLGLDRWSAVASALLLLSMPTFIEYSCIAESYTLALSLLLIAFIIAISRKSSVQAIFYFTGLSLSASAGSVLALPGLLLMGFKKFDFSKLTNKEFRLKITKTMILSFIALFLGLSVYMYLPVRARLNPPGTWQISDSSLKGITGFITLAKWREDKSEVPQSSLLFRARIVWAAKSFIHQLTIPGFLFVLTGMFSAFKIINIKTASALMLSILLPYFLSSYMMKFTFETQAVQEGPKLAMISLALSGIAALIPFSFLNGSAKKVALTIITLLIIVRIGYSVKNSRTHDADLLAQHVKWCEENLPPNSSLNTHRVFAHYYHQCNSENINPLILNIRGEDPPINRYRQKSLENEKVISSSIYNHFYSFKPSTALPENYKRTVYGALYADIPIDFPLNKDLSIDGYMFPDDNRLKVMHYQLRELAARLFLNQSWLIRPDHKEKSKILLEKATRISTDLPNLLPMIADQWDALTGNNDKSIQILSKHVQLYPYHSSPLIALARREFHNGSLDIAVSHIKNALELNIRNTIALNLLGSIYASTGELKKSLEIFKAALSIKPNDELIKKNISLIEETLNNH